MRTRVIAGLLFLLITATVAHAQASRTWVSGVGDDANPCSRTAPCKTFAGAISKTTAGGEIDALDPGGYGAVTITKAITIDGGGGQVASVLVAGTNGIVVSAGASDVVILRNLRINGLNGSGLSGIYVLGAGSVHVEHCDIFGFGVRGIDFETSGSLFVSDTSIKASGGAAIYVTNARATIEGVTASGNQSGVVVASGATVSVKRSVLSGNGMGVAAAYAASALLEVDDSLIANNQWGVVASQGATARLNNVSVFDNYLQGLFRDGSSYIMSFGNNHLAGNAVDGSFNAFLTTR